MRRDFIADRYWRLWHLPVELARRGHAVEGFATAYYRGCASGLEVAAAPGSIRWSTTHLFGLSPLSWRSWWIELLGCATAFAPDAIVASSDALQLWAGRRLAGALGVPLIVDFYDNYESYGASRVPGATAAMRAAARAAAGTVFVSEPLRAHLVERYGLTAPALTLENAVDETFLAPPPRARAREMLGLPAAAQLIGTAGALDASRNIGALYEAFVQLAAELPQLHLVLAGEPKVAPPSHPRVIALGTLATGRMPAFWAALDVASIGLRDDAFGRYCYPQKLAEIAAVGTPMVFPRIGVFKLQNADAFGVATESNGVADLAAAVSRQLARPRAPSLRPAIWTAIAAGMEDLLERTLRAKVIT